MIWRAAATTIVTIALARVAHGGEPQLFNTDLLGRSTGEAVKLLVDRQQSDVEPFVIWTDVHCGQYVSASAFYRAPITFQSLRAAINKRFLKYETSVSENPAMAIWRVTDPGNAAGISAVAGKPQPILAIQVANADDETVRVIYMLGTTRPCPSEAEK